MKARLQKVSVPVPDMGSNKFNPRTHGGALHQRVGTAALHVKLAAEGFSCLPPANRNSKGRIWLVQQATYMVRNEFPLVEKIKRMFDIGLGSRTCTRVLGCKATGFLRAQRPKAKRFLRADMCLCP